MKLPALVIDTAKIRHNTRVVSSMLGELGMRLVGVPKSVLGHPAVVKAMVEGGAAAIADSRVENLARAREGGYAGETVLLRSPAPSRVDEAVAVADVSLNSEVEVVRMLAKAARKANRTHKVVLMVDLGDLREGVPVHKAVETAKAMSSEDGVKLAGIGVNLACYGGVIPTREKMEALLKVRDDIESSLGLKLETVSGGNSANMPLVMNKEMPAGITELRIGESVLLGTEAVHRSPVPGCYPDAFTIVAEVIELQTKPSKPEGQVGQNAFGLVVTFPDRGIRKRAICAAGRQDIDPDGLTPLEPGVQVLGASSDHLILDVQDAGDVKVGSMLRFIPAYSSLLQAATSPFVEKVVR